MSEICTQGHGGEDCANGEISGVALTGRVYEPRSVRPLLTYCDVSVVAAGKPGLTGRCDRHHRKRPPTPFSLKSLARSAEIYCARVHRGIPSDFSMVLCWGRRPESIGVEFDEGIPLEGRER